MTRREVFCAALGLPALGLVERAAAVAPRDVRLKSFDVLTAKVGPRSWVLFRLTTESGLTGIGDATHNAAVPTLATQVARRLFEGMRGRSVFEIERLRQAALPLEKRSRSLGRGQQRPHAVAFAGLEQAMWDLQGKALGVPCYELFGGKLRDEVRNYANINRMTRGDERTPEGFAKNARRAVAGGFDAFKLAPFDHMPRSTPDGPERDRMTAEGLEMTAAVREAIGPERDLLLDAHGRFNREQALDVARRLEPYGLYWLEEVTPEIDDLAAVNREAKMSTAGGESLFGVHQFLPYVAGGAVDILMPDVKFCGGMSELKKIAALGEAAGMDVAPHGPASPVGNMAAAHVCASIPNFRILEFGYGEVPWRAESVSPAEDLRNGRLQVLDRPGIGYEPAGPEWRRFEG